LNHEPYMLYYIYEKRSVYVNRYGPVHADS